MGSTDEKREQEAAWGLAAPGWSTWDEVLLRSRMPVTLRMLELGRVAEGDRVLDIASGTGEPAIDAAVAVGPTGSVLGTDIAEPMLAVAREKARRRGLENIVFRQVDGEQLDVEPGSVDVVTCRFGLMFMPDPLACLARCHTALRPGGRMVAGCWTEAHQNPWASVPLDVCRRRLGASPLPPGAADMFALADPIHLRQLFREAGFGTVDIVEQSMAWGPFETVESAVAFVSDAIGPVTAMLAGMSVDDRAAAAREMAAEFEHLRTPAGVSLPGVTWIVTGTA